MNQAELFLWSVLHGREELDQPALMRLVARVSAGLHSLDPEQRRSDMQAAVGLWASRSDLPDAQTYISRLREDARLGSTE